MTTNQINYWKVMNDRAAIDVNEAHYIRSDTETVRHNKEVERQGVLGLNETNRHNVESELIGRSQAAAAQTSASASYMNAQTNRYLAPTTAELNKAKYMQIGSEMQLNKAKTALTEAQTKYTDTQESAVWPGLIGDWVTGAIQSGVKAATMVAMAGG